MKTLVQACSIGFRFGRSIADDVQALESHVTQSLMHFILSRDFKTEPEAPRPAGELEQTV